MPVNIDFYRDWVKHLTKTFGPAKQGGSLLFGAEESINGGIAQADVLGIFGREGVDIGTRWVCPKVNTPAFRAIQLYRNYDGKNGAFGDTSVHCETAANPDDVVALPHRTARQAK